MKKILGLCCTIWCGQLGAQTADTLKLLESDSLHPLQHLIISDGWIGITDRKSSLDITRVAQDDWRANRALNFAQSLAFMPGMNAQNTGVGVARPVIRGMMGQRIVVVENGVKQEGQQWGSDHGLEQDMFTVDGLEVIKGAAGLMYGGDAIGGVIKLLPPKWIAGKRELRFSMQGSNNNQERGVEGAYQQKWFWKKSGFASRIVFAASQKSSSDYRLPASQFTYLNRTLPLEDGILNNTATQENSVMVLWELIHASRMLQHLMLQYRRYEQSSGLFPGFVGIPTLASVTSDGNLRNIGWPAAQVEHHKWMVSSTWKGKRLTHECLGSFQSNHRQEMSIPHQGAFVANTSSQRALDLKLIDAQLRYVCRNWSWWNGNGEVGFLGQKQWNSRNGFEFLIPDFQKQVSAVWGIWNKALNNLEGQWMAGARWDYVGYRTPGFTRTIEWNQDLYYWQPVNAGARQFQGFSGSLGQSISTSPSLHLKWHVGRTYRMPQASELFINGVHHGTFRHELGDPDLMSEKGWQWDGMLIKSSEDWVLKCSPFVQYYSSYIYLSPQARFSILPDGGQLYAYQQHPVWMGGGECNFDVHVLPELHADCGVEYVANYNVRTTLPLPFTPPFQIKWGSTYQGMWSENWEWSCQFQVRYAAAQKRVDRNERETPDYAIVHGGFSVEYHNSRDTWYCIWSVNGRNLTDVKYLNNLSNYRALGLPEQGRWIQTGLEFRWKK